MYLYSTDSPPCYLDLSTPCLDFCLWWSLCQGCHPLWHLHPHLLGQWPPSGQDSTLAFLSPGPVLPLRSALVCSWPFQASQGLAMSYSFLCGQCLFLVGTQSIRDGWMILRSGQIMGLLGEFSELTLWVRWFRLCCVTNDHQFSVASNTKILFLSHTISPAWATGRRLCSS